jgi:hypothetical protein
MRRIVTLCVLSVASCGQEPCVTGPDNPFVSTTYGPNFHQNWSYEGVGDVTQVAPVLQVTYDGRTESLYGVDSGLQVSDSVQVSEASSIGLPSGSTRVTLSDVDGLVVAEWSASTWSGNEIPGWSLTYENDTCGDPDMTNPEADIRTPTKTLTASNGDGRVVLPSGTHADIGGYVVTNGHSFQSRRGDKVATRHQGSIVRKHL